MFSGLQDLDGMLRIKTPQREFTFRVGCQFMA